MGAEYTRGKSDSSTGGPRSSTLLTSRWLRPLLLLVIVACAVAVGLLLVRPVAAAAYLSAGSRALEEARRAEAPTAELEQAVRLLTRARELDSASSLVLRRLAEAAALQGRSDEEVRLLEAALRLEPGSLLIRRLLLDAHIQAGRLDDALKAFGELKGGSVNPGEVFALLERAGKVEQAIATIGERVVGNGQVSPELLVRAALAANRIGDTEEAVSLLSASGLPEFVAPVQETSVATNATSSALFPPDLLVNGLPQGNLSQAAVLLMGDGWYPYDTSYGRWARSPAVLLVYLPSAQQVTLGLDVIGLYDPGADLGLGDAGYLLVGFGGSPALGQKIYAHQRNEIGLDLPAGWTMVKLELTTGNFRPQELDRASGDTRWLSFALAQIDLVLPAS